MKKPILSVGIVSPLIKQMKISFIPFCCLIVLFFNKGIAQDGSLDTTFGDQGNAIHYLANDISLEDHAIDQGISGRIATSGIQYGVLTDEGYIRVFLENGAIDTSFGNNGVVYIDPNSLGPFGPIHVLDDNSVLFSTGAGGYLRKLQANGVVDSSFGNAGVLTMNGQDISGTGHNLLSDGSIFLTGFTNQLPKQFIIKKYDPDGVLDASFGNQGTASFPIGSFFQISLKTLLIKPDNSIIVNYSLRPSVNNPYTAYMSKLFPDGSLDTTFGTNGRLTLDIENSENANFFLHDTNHILVSIYYYDQQLVEYVRRIIKLTQDGEVDTSFANNGILLDHSVEIVEQNQRIITNATFPDFEGGMVPNLYRFFSNGAIDSSFNFEYTYTELLSISTTSTPQGDFLLSGGDIWYNGPAINLLIAKYNSTPLGFEDVILEALKIYPNPVQDMLFIGSDTSIEIESIQIYSLLGELVMGQGRDTHQLDVSKLSSGVYILKVNTSSGEFTKKLVKE